MAPSGATGLTAGPVRCDSDSGLLDSPHVFPPQVHSAVVASPLSPMLVNSLLITVGGGPNSEYFMGAMSFLTCVDDFLLRSVAHVLV